MDEDEDGGYGEYGSPPRGHKWDDDGVPTNDDLEYQDNQQIIEDCRELLKSKDYMMEASCSLTVNKFLSAGGYPQEFVESLSDNYHGVAQLANLLADWLIVSGASVEEVQSLVESQLKDLILKNFDPKKADSIFTGAGQPPGWIEEMIVHPPWRMMFYELAEMFPDCLMLNFTIKLISDAGYQTEIGSMASVCNQIEVFSKVLKTSLINYFTPNVDHQKMLSDFIEKGTSQDVDVKNQKSICNGKHMYVYAQCMLAEIAERLDGQTPSACIKRLSQELSLGALNSGHELWYLVLIFLGCGKHPRVFSSILSLMERKALNPGDITVLYKAYSSETPPPVAFLQIPALLEMLTSALFLPGSNISEDHKPKYSYLLAYAVSVYESWDEGSRDDINQDELKPTLQAIERIHLICSSDLGSSSFQLTADVGILYQCLRKKVLHKTLTSKISFPVVAMGVMRWVGYCLSEKNYAKIITETVPLQIVLLDEISTIHVLHHELVGNLLIELFNRNYPELDTLLELEFKKTIVDRMLHLMSRGYIMPIVLHLKECMDRQTTDVSLLRHFLTEVLEMIGPPFSADFIAAMLPIAQNKEITAVLKMSDGSDDVTKFLAQCEDG